VPQCAAAAAQAGFLLSTSVNMSAPAEITTLTFVNTPMGAGTHQPSLFKMLMRGFQIFLWWRLLAEEALPQQKE